MAPFAQKRILAHLKPGAAPVGRPSLYKPEYCQAVVDAMSTGISLTAFAATIGVDKQSVYEWQSRHSEFSHAVARAKVARLLFLERKLLNARYGAQASASIFALKNADPQEWRDMRSVSHEHSHSLQVLTDEQLLAIVGAAPGAAPAIEGECTRMGTALGTESDSDSER
jgi:hypothetical protein